MSTSAMNTISRSVVLKYEPVEKQPSISYNLEKKTLTLTHSHANLKNLISELDQRGLSSTTAQKKHLTNLFDQIAQCQSSLAALNNPEDLAQLVREKTSDDLSAAGTLFHPIVSGLGGVIQTAVEYDSRVSNYVLGLIQQLDNK